MAAGDGAERVRRARGGSLLRRLLRARDGTTAVEFGLLAAPFFALLFAILEVALFLWSGQVLETAIADASRQLYTGQFQADPTNATLTGAQIAEKFKKNVCVKASALVWDCEARIKVDVRAFGTSGGFKDVNLPNIKKDGEIDPSAFTYQNPKPNEIVVVRAAIEHPVYVAALTGASTTSLKNGKRLIVGAAAFKVEPYQATN